MERARTEKMENCLANFHPFSACFCVCVRKLIKFIISGAHRKNIKEEAFFMCCVKMS